MSQSCTIPMDSNYEGPERRSSPQPCPFDDDIKRINKTLEGNGKKGLVSDVRDLKEQIHMVEASVDSKVTEATLGIETKIVRLEGKIDGLTIKVTGILSIITTGIALVVKYLLP